MRSNSCAAAVVGALLISWIEVPSAAGPDNACALLTLARVSAALGTAVGNGQPIVVPTACQWGAPGKMLTLTITQPRGNRSPVDIFNVNKANPAFPSEPVSGVGEEAYYVAVGGRPPIGLVVRKRNSVFELRIYGFELEPSKTITKALAQEVAAKF